MASIVLSSNATAVLFFFFFVNNIGAHIIFSTEHLREIEQQQLHRFMVVGENRTCGKTFTCTFSRSSQTHISNMFIHLTYWAVYI